MKFTYEDLLSGIPIYVKGIGHFRSPRIKELHPSVGIGYQQYNIHINILSWDKLDLINVVKGISKKQYLLFEKADKLNAFDIISLQPYLLTMVKSSLEFFMCEILKWDENNKKFITMSKNNPTEIIGEINRLNYDETRDMVLQMNYVNISKDESPMKHFSKRAKEAWEKAQKFLQTESKKSKENKSFRLCNVISKLSVLPTGYTLFNIYDLTVFQLYDQFIQYGYLRAMDLNERAYSVNGGDYKFESWLKPIIKI